MRGPLKTSVAVALLSTLALSARSDDIPVLNVESACNAFAEQADPSASGSPDLILATCIKNELEVREQLVKRWSTFVSADKENCVRELKMDDETSYTDLLICLELAQGLRDMQTDSSEQNTR
jgi:hypothetical protein